MAVPGTSGDTSATGVRYQLSFDRLARQCTLVGTTLVMKVGVQGRIVVGPSGGPGQVDVPLRYAVPPKADLELWDSGMAIAARAGDTLQTLAAQYRVPLWALAQANQLPDNIPLGASQRVVVPRHLAAPVAIAAEPVSSKR